MAVHLAIIAVLRQQLGFFGQDTHLGRVQSMGTIDGLTAVFVAIPVPDDQKTATVKELGNLAHHSGFTLAVSALSANEMRKEVRGELYDPLGAMLKHCR